jgi:hypothetical protein
VSLYRAAASRNVPADPGSPDRRPLPGTHPIADPPFSNDMN